MKSKSLITEKAAEGSFVLQNQRPGRIVNGKFVPINIGALSAAEKKRLDDDLKRYTAERERKYGKGQLQKDLQTSQRVAAEQEARRKAEAKAKAEAEAKARAQSSPSPAPAQPAPAQSSGGGGGGGGGGGSTPAPAPAAPAKPAPAAPKPSPVADYMKASAAARKSGDPAEMAKVRDMGMDIWRKSNPKLAAAAAERERIRGTAQTDNPLMKDMRDRLPVTPTVQAPAVKDLGLGQQSLAQNKFAGRSPEPAKPAPTPVPQVSVSTDKEMAKTSDALSKNPLKKEVKKEAYDIVLDYLLSEGHAETLSEAHYVMLQMDPEHIQNIVQERAWWDPTGLFMDKREREVEKAKSSSTGGGASYNPNTGLTYNPSARNQSRAVGVIAPKGGVVGTMEPGKPSTWQRYAPGSDPYRRQNIDRYVTATGTSYERRTPTSAELAAARAAGGGEAGVKAAVDVTRSNKVAATSPTPDLKPEAPKKRESLAAQLGDLQKMRKAAEEINK